jgi:hypothetical protein
LCVVGNVKERKDQSGNTIFSGEIKISAVAGLISSNQFRLPQKLERRYRNPTAFAEVSYYTFEGSGITSNNSLLPGASGKFEMVIPKDSATLLVTPTTLIGNYINNV